MQALQRDPMTTEQDPFPPVADVYADSTHGSMQYHAPDFESHNHLCRQGNTKVGAEDAAVDGLAMAGHAIAT